MLEKFLKLKIKQNSNKGFTLIELLVVVAIIGILSSVVLASLSSAREKARIASVKSNMKNMVTEAELYYSDNGTYSGMCNNTTGACNGTMAKYCNSIISNGDTVACYAVNKRWGATVKLNSDSTKNYTVNQQGIAVFDTSNISPTGLPWSSAGAACSNNGGRLPSAEQLKTLYMVWGGTPTGYPTPYYWSGTTEDLLDASPAVVVGMHSGSIYYDNNTGSFYVRCVR